MSCAHLFWPESYTHLSLPGQSDSQDFTLKHQTRRGGTAVAPGMPRSGSGEEPYILGTPPSQPLQGRVLRGVCIIFGSLFEWWTEPHLSSLCRDLAFTGWKGRVWMRCMFLWLCRLPRQGMEHLLEPMGSTHLDDLLDDWFQVLEPSVNLDGDQKGAQVVSSSKTHWSRVRDGVWPMRKKLGWGSR